jgi:hypothetical protein
MRRYHMQSTLSRGDVLRGVYVDFEDLSDNPPAMLSLYWVTPDEIEHLETLIFDKNLPPASSANELELVEGTYVWLNAIEDAFERVLEISVELDVPIIVLSKRERHVLEPCDISDLLRSRLGKRIVNALPVTVEWIIRNHERSALVPDARGNRFTPSNFAKLTGFESSDPEVLADHSDGLRHVISEIEMRSEYVGISRKAKGYWQHFLKHKETVLRVNRHMMIHVVPQTFDVEARRPRRQINDLPYATKPFPEDCCPDCGGLLSRYVYGFTRDLPPGQISGGCELWPGRPSYRCDYCWEDFVAVKNQWPRRVTRRDRCLMMVKEWRWSKKSVASNQGVPIKTFERWLGDAELVED